MTWAARRRFLIIIILIVVIGGLSFWHYSPSIFIAPTCSDHRQNADEHGIDCGGTMCSIMCTADISVPTVLWSRSFPVTSTVYNAAAYVQNKNASATRAVAYEFRLYDADNNLVARRDGTTFIPPLGNYAIVETGIQSGNATVARTTFQFSSTPAVWERISETLGKLRLGTSNIVLDTTSPIPKLTAVLTDQSTTISLKNIAVAAVLYDAADNAVSVSRTVIPSLMPLKSASVVFTWPRAFAVPVVRYEILPLIDVFHAE